MGIRVRDVLITIGVFVVIGLVWEGVVRFFHVASYLVPAPSAVFREFLSRPRLYADHTWVTAYETLLGFLFAAILGIVAAILIVYSRFLEVVLYPLLVVLQIVPKVAIGPLLLIWVGFGVQSKILLALLIAFFPVVVDTITGLRSVDSELLDLVRVLRGKRWQEFTKIRFPHALPYIFSGLKVAITLAVIGAIIGEFVGGNEGLGYLITIANTELNTSMSFAALMTLSLLGLLLFLVVSGLERLLVPWARASERSGLIGGGG